MKNSPLISVIIPIYNVEGCLRECVDSVLSQTYKDLEIILVDDGSSDDSGKIADEYLKKDKRIRVIHKKNAGLGFARNSGIEVMNGEFVMFVDSDDYIAEDLVDNLYKHIKEQNVDMVKSGYVRFSGEHEHLSESGYKNEIFEGAKKDSFLLRMLGSTSLRKNNSIEMGATACLYKTELIRKFNVRFPSEREVLSEDLVFNVNFVKDAKILSTVDIVGYFYRNNQASLTKRYREDRFGASKKLYKLLREYFKNSDDDGLMPRMINKLFMRYIRVCISQEKKSISKKSICAGISNIKNICQDEMVVKAAKNCPMEIMDKKQKTFIKLILNKHSILLYILANIGAF